MSNTQGNRKVMVLTTIGKSGVVVETTAENWGNLRRDLSRNGVVVDNMNAVEGISRMSFENDDAALPTGDFKIFLSPKETKSGWTEEEEKIERLLEKHGDKANRHFNQGMHYTDKSNKALVTLLESWKEMRRREREERVEQPKAEVCNVDYSAKAILTRLKAIKEALDEAIELAELASEADDVTAKPFAKGPSRSSSDDEEYDDDDRYDNEFDDDDDF